MRLNEHEFHLMLLVLASFLLISLYFLFPQITLEHDGNWYDIQVEQMINGGGIGIERSFGYPFFLFVLYTIFGKSLEVLTISNMFLYLISLSIIFTFSKKIFGFASAIFTGLFFILDPSILHLVYHGRCEILYITLIVFSFYFLHKFIEKKLIRYLIVFSFIFSYSVAVKSGIKYLVAIYLLIFMIMFFKSKKTFYNVFFYFIIIYLIVISPFLFFSFYKTGSFQLSTVEGRNLCEYMAAKIYSLEHDIPLDEARKIICIDYYTNYQTSDSVERTRIMRGLYFIIENPLKVLKYNLNNLHPLFLNAGPPREMIEPQLLANSLGFNVEIKNLQDIFSWYLHIVFLLAVFGLFRLKSYDKSVWFHVFVLTYILYITLTHVHGYIEDLPRYRAMFSPLLLMYSGYGASLLLKYMRSLIMKPKIL